MLLVKIIFNHFMTLFYRIVVPNNTSAFVFRHRRTFHAYHFLQHTGGFESELPRGMMLYIHANKTNDSSKL